MSGLHLTIPDELLEHIVVQVTEKVRAELAAASPWMTRAEAAGYLRVPLSRLEKDRTVPSHRWDGRVLYNRAELDEWVSAQ
jgi:hypothetical protein